MIMRNSVILVSSLLLLTACQDRYTYSYLIQHPEFLKQAVAVCQTKETNSAEQTPPCEITLYAAAQFTSILNEQEANPEQFGQHLLEKQMTYQQNELALIAAQKKYTDLAQQHAAPAELQAAQDKLNKEKKLVAEQKTEIDLMLAVIGVNSPE